MAKNAMNVMTLATALRAYRMRKCGIASSHLTKISQRASCSGYWMSKRSGYPGAPATAVSTDILHPFPLTARELLERELRFPLEAATAQTAYVSASGLHLRPVQHGQPQRQAVLAAHQRLAGPLGGRDPQPLAGPAGDRERRLRVLDAQVDPDAAVLKRIVPHQRAGQQVRLAEDLEAVADADHRLAGLGVRRHRLHHRREGGDRPRTQVVAVR